ncbi:hypothetical protein JOE66_002681 [Subtercola frigoramans]|uniref:Uncharacterized protein n=1 Tax=Subtercola frigoramans TaxID=120298 RepID=A0ABS2L7I8_9MICO|nr:hypothetical protein [Subtercola frigoramans]
MNRNLSSKLAALVGGCIVAGLLVSLSRAIESRGSASVARDVSESTGLAPEQTGYLAERVSHDFEPTRHVSGSTGHLSVFSAHAQEMSGDRPGRNDRTDEAISREVHAFTAHSSASDPGYEAASNDLDWSLSEVV